LVFRYFLPKAFLFAFLVNKSLSPYISELSACLFEVANVEIDEEGVEPKACDQGRSKNGDLILLAMLPLH